jgi:hypothetical protein
MVNPYFANVVFKSAAVGSAANAALPTIPNEPLNGVPKHVTNTVQLAQFWRRHGPGVYRCIRERTDILEHLKKELDEILNQYDHGPDHDEEFWVEKMGTVLGQARLLCEQQLHMLDDDILKVTCNTDSFSESNDCLMLAGLLIGQIRRAQAAEELLKNVMNQMDVAYKNELKDQDGHFLAANIWFNFNKQIKEFLQGH